MWSTSTGGATGASAPAAGDDVTLDGATCVGGTTCTITTFAGTISAQSITWGTCTASTTGCIIAANTNNTNFAITASNGTLFSGSGTRKWVGGTGTYTLTANGAFAAFFTMATTTNDQGSTFNSATWVLGGTAGSGSARSFTNGGFSIGPLTLNSNSSGGPSLFVGSTTFASLTINGPNYVAFANGSTFTMTGGMTITGSSNTAAVLITSNTAPSTATISLGAASTGTWIGLQAIVFSGAGALTGSNCFNFGLVTLNGGTCATPGGGGGGGRIIGG
jgi:hypothetical protein